MRQLPLALLAALVLPLASSADDSGAPEGDGWTAVDLAYVPCPKDFPFRVFDGAPAGISGTSLPLPTKGGSGIAVAPEEFAIGVDVNGDGKVDDRLKSDGATATFTLTYPDGFSAPYVARFARNRQKAWTFERSGYWGGKAGKETIAVFDNSNNGRYDDFGKDAVVVGSSQFAIPLSKVVSLGGVLSELRVAPSGKRLWVREYKGPTGKIDVVSDYKAAGKLTAAVFRSEEISINAIGKEKELVVPAGTYKLVGGEVAAATGGQKATIRPGTMAEVVVKAGESAKVAWGMPLKLTFAANVAKNELNIKGLEVKAFGAGGEEYTDFAPMKLTPEVTIWAPASPKPLLSGGLHICPQGTLDDFHGALGTSAGPWKVQLNEPKFSKLLGEFASEVVEIR